MGLPEVFCVNKNVIKIYYYKDVNLLRKYLVNVVMEISGYIG